MYPKDDLSELTIVGGGPAGLFAAFYAGLREMKVKIIEAQPKLGGKVHVYQQKMIWDIGGLPPLSGHQLIRHLVQQGLTFEPEVVLKQKVTRISKNADDIFVLETNTGHTHYSKTVLLTIGGGIIDPIKLEVEGAQQYENINLFYSVKDLRDFRNKTVLISGGGPSAVDWANELAPIARSVTLIYRGKELKGHEADISKLKTQQVDCRPATEIVRLIGRDRIERVCLKNNKTQFTEELDVDCVLVNHGYHRDHSLLRNSPLNIDLIDDFFVKGTTFGESTVPGLFAAGDILYHEGKLRLIAGAFQDAAHAVNRAKLYLDPNACEMAQVSSHNSRLVEKNKKFIFG